MSRSLLTAADRSTLAPNWNVQQWFNADDGLSLQQLRGRVVVLHAFQMLCPGCVSHGVPQAARIRETFSPERVAVVGLHSVFEHHAAMTPIALEAFLHEYRVTFPVGVDTPGTDTTTPVTMATYRFRGTPTLVLIDAVGRLRAHLFGRAEDLIVGAAVATLVSEADRGSAEISFHPADATGCTTGACSA